MQQDPYSDLMALVQATSTKDLQLFRKNNNLGGPRNGIVRRVSREQPSLQLVEQLQHLLRHAINILNIALLHKDN